MIKIDPALETQNLATSHNFASLRAQIQKWDKRRRLTESAIWLPRGLLGGLLLATALAASVRLWPLLTTPETLRITLVLALLGIFLSALVVWLRPRSLAHRAIFADGTFALKERVSSAVEIESGQLAVPEGWAQRQLGDTLQATAVVDTKKMLPVLFKRDNWLMVGLALLLLAVAFYLPNPQEAALLEARALAAALDEEVAELETLAEEIQEDVGLTEVQKEALVEPLTEALAALDEGDLGRAETVAILSEAEADLKSLEAQNSQADLQKSLDEAASNLSGSASQALASALSSGNLSAAASALFDLADNLDGLTAEEMAALAAQLAALAESLAEIDSELAAQLAAAAEALAAGDVAAAAEALNQAAATMQDRAGQQAAAQAAAAAAGQLSEGRQSVAGAGQSGQSGQPSEGGQSGQGGNQSGEGGQGSGEGSGEGSGSGDGNGSGNGDGNGNGSGSGSGSEGGEGTGAGGTGPGGGHAENLYVPEPIDLSGEEGVDVELPAECVNNPDACGQIRKESPTAFSDEEAIVPYTQVFGDYRDAAYQALDEDYVPLGMKGYVRDYFSSLEP